MSIKIKKDGQVREFILPATNIQVLDMDNKFKKKDLENVLREVSDTEHIHVGEVDETKDGIWIDDGEILDNAEDNGVVERIKTYVDGEMDKKSDKTHNHDDRYYKVTTITSATDFNTITTEGIYKINTINNANVPSDTYGILFVSNQGTLFQVFHQDNDYSTFKRVRRNDGTWTDWVKFANKKDLDARVNYTFSNNYDFNDGADKSEIRRLAINGGTLKNSPDGNNGGVLLNFVGSHAKWNTQLYNSQGGTMWYRNSIDASNTTEWKPWKMVSLYEDSIPTLLNGWEFWDDYNHGKVFSRQGNFGCVSLLVKKSTSDDMTVIAKTPFTPQKRIITTAFCNGKCIECRLEANGEIRLSRVGYVSNAWLNINIFYPIKFYNL